MIIREFLSLLGFKSDNSELNKYTKAIGAAVKITAALGIGAVAMGTAFLKAAGDMEQTEIAFTTMLGSAEKADELIKEITNFAATTPFELKGLVASSKQLLAFGFQSEEIIDTMTNLGNIAAGVGRDKLPTLISSFGKIRTKGKATMEELNMMLEAGVPILDQLAKNYGVTTKEISEMVSKGKIGFKDVQKALTNLGTGQGGVVNFGGLMEKQSKSFLGIVSNIGDVLTNLSIAIGKDLLPIGKELAKAFLDFLEANKELIKSKIVGFLKNIAFVVAVIFVVIRRLFNHFRNFIKQNVDMEKIGKRVSKVFFGIVRVVGGFVRMIIKAVKFGLKFKELFLSIIAVFLAYKATILVIQLVTKAWAAIQGILNVIMSANPIGLIIAAIVALVIAIFWLIENWDVVVKFLKDTGQKIVDFLLRIWTGFKDFFINIWNIIVAKVKEILGKIRDKFNEFKEFVGTIATAVKEAFSKAFNAVKSVFDKIIGKLKKGFDDFVGKVTGIIEKIKTKINEVKAFFGFETEEDKTAKKLPNRGINNAITAPGNRTSSVTIHSNPNITVPPGTPEQQQEFLRETAKQVVEEEMGVMLRNTITNTNNVDFAGGF